MSAMEWADVATFTFGTWQIRSCLLCKFISSGACPLSFPSIFRSFRKENRIAELFHWNKFKDWKENEIFCKPSKGFATTRKDYVIGREITTILKKAVDRIVATFMFAAWQILTIMFTLQVYYARSPKRRYQVSSFAIFLAGWMQLKWIIWLFDRSELRDLKEN